MFPQRQTMVPSKAHKPNTLAVLRKEHAHFSIALVMWFTKPSWLEMACPADSLFFILWRIIRVCVCLHLLEYYSFKTDPALQSLSSRLLDLRHRCSTGGRICLRQLLVQILLAGVVVFCYNLANNISNDSIGHKVIGRRPVCHLSDGITVSV